MAVISKEKVQVKRGGGGPAFESDGKLTEILLRKP